MIKPDAKYTFTRFAYFDTNILSHVAKNRDLWPKLFDFFSESGLTMGVGFIPIAEISDAYKLHKELTALIVSVPSGLLKGWDVVIAEEVQAHPDYRKDTLLALPLNKLLLEKNGLENFFNFLSSERLRAARGDQLQYAKQLKARIAELKHNFPPSKSGKYTRDQADEFANCMVIQWLGIDYRKFLARFQGHIEDFHPEVFLSIRLYAYVIFYKYYLGQREPKKLSDFADLGHLFLIPYCELALMEKNLCVVLNQIKRNHDILKSTDIYDLDFLNNFG